VNLLGAPSRDGRYLSFVEPGTGHLALRHLETGVTRTLVKAARGQFAYFSTIAPGNGLVAYAWFNEQGFYDLRTVSLVDGEVRVLHANEEAGFVQPCAFSPDGTKILTLLFRKDNISQIALVPVAGGAPTVLRSLNWVYPKKMDFSPDGRFIVYDSFAQDGGPDRTLFVLRADGSGTETRLLTAAGHHMFPQWSPDGASIVYASNNDLAVIPVREGKAAGEPRVWQAGLGRLVPLGFARDGAYFYGLRSGTVDVELALLDGSDPRRVSLRYPGRNTAPAFSPDGRSIAYLSRRGMENFGQETRAIVVRSLVAKDEIEVPQKMAHLASVRWSYDGAALLVAGTDGQGRAGLFQVDATTGDAKLLVRDEYGGAAGLDGVWLSAAELAYIASDGVRVRAADGKTKLLAEGTFSLLTGAKGRLAWLGREGIHFYDGQSTRVWKAPATTLTELVFARDGLLAGNGQELWSVPLDGTAAKPLGWKAARSGRLSVHPHGNRVAYTVGGTESSVQRMKLPQ